MVVREILLLLVMFWNVENFFDPFEGNSHGVVQDKFVDILSKSGEMVKEPFTPRGEKFWTWKKFSKKRDDIAKSIALVKDRYGVFPAVVGLCEVENRFVLQQLTQNTILAELGYSIIHKDSPDRRGIDAALLYRKEVFSPLKVQFIPTVIPAASLIPAASVVSATEVISATSIIPAASVVGSQTDTILWRGSVQKESMQVRDTLQVRDTMQSREMVYVKGVFGGLDTLHFFVVHWPSKLGGEKESIARRMAASNTLKHVADSILVAEPGANIVVMGDFNDGADADPVTNINNLVNMSVWESARGEKVENEKKVEKVKKERKREPYRWFTYKYKESWSRIDHFLVSRNLWRDSIGLQWLFCKPGSSEVFCHKFFLEDDNLYLGYKIRRTLVGPRYNGGVSDHLPVILKVFGYEY